MALKTYTITYVIGKTENISELVGHNEQDVINSLLLHLTDTNCRDLRIISVLVKGRLY